MENQNRTPVDFKTLDSVTVSLRRPSKWYMYVVKRVLREKNSVDIKARPDAASQVIRVAEALKRLGYVEYCSYKTESKINEDSVVSRFLVVNVKKTADFDKLFDEREKERDAQMKENDTKQ